MVYFNYINKERLKKLADIEAAVQRLDQLDKQNKRTELLEQDLERKKSEQAALMKPENKEMNCWCK